MAQYTGPDGTTFDLPKMTTALHAKQDATDVSDISEKSARCYDFLAQVLPADALAEYVDGKSAKDADMTKVLSIYSQVDDAYWHEYRDSQIDDMRTTINNFSDMGSFVDAMTKMQALTSGRKSRQVFRA